MTIVKSKRMNNRFKRGSYIKLKSSPRPDAWDKFSQDVKGQMLQMVTVLKVMGVQQKTEEYLLRSISDPNCAHVLRERIELIDVFYELDDDCDPEFYRTLYSKE